MQTAKGCVEPGTCLQCTQNTVIKHDGKDIKLSTPT